MKKVRTTALILIVLLLIVSDAFGATGNVTITSHNPDQTYEATGGFTVSGTYIMTEDNTPSGRVPQGICPSGIGYYQQYSWDSGNRAFLRYYVDDVYKGQIGRIYQKVGWAPPPYDNLNVTESFQAAINVTGLDPNIPHKIEFKFVNISGIQCCSSLCDNLWGGYDDGVFASATLNFRICGSGGCNVCTDGETKACPYSGPQGTENKGICKAGTQTCVNGQWGVCQGEVLPAAQEICGDNLDNNCDGNVDEGCCEAAVSVSPAAVWPLKTGNDDKTKATVMVSLTKPAPSEGCNVKLKVEPVEHSGGHLHDSGRNNHKGTVSPASFKMSGGIIAALFTYKSSEVAGMEKIKVEVNGKEAGEAMVRVQVPGLWQLSGGNYRLKCYIESCAGYRHEDFYNVQSWVNGLFNKIAYPYRQKFPTAQLLVVTDASLANGGLYDYQDTWSPPHKTHRIGTDIDVRSKNIPEGNRDKFKEIVCDNYGLPKLEFPGQTNEHYHLFFLPYKSTGKLCKGEIPI